MTKSSIPLAKCPKLTHHHGHKLKEIKVVLRDIMDERANGFSLEQCKQRGGCINSNCEELLKSWKAPTRRHRLPKRLEGFVVDKTVVHLIEFSEWYNSGRIAYHRACKKYSHSRVFKGLSDSVSHLHQRRRPNAELGRKNLHQDCETYSRLQENSGRRRKDEKCSNSERIASMKDTQTVVSAIQQLPCASVKQRRRPKKNKDKKTATQYYEKENRDYQRNVSISLKVKHRRPKKTKDAGVPDIPKWKVIQSQGENGLSLKRQRTSPPKSKCCGRPKKSRQTSLNENEISSDILELIQEAEKLIRSARAGNPDRSAMVEGTQSVDLQVEYGLENATVENVTHRLPYSGIKKRGRPKKNKGVGNAVNKKTETHCQRAMSQSSRVKHCGRPKKIKDAGNPCISKRKGIQSPGENGPQRNSPSKSKCRGRPKKTKRAPWNDDKVPSHILELMREADKLIQSASNGIGGQFESSVNDDVSCTILCPPIQKSQADMVDGNNNIIVSPSITGSGILEAAIEQTIGVPGDLDNNPNILNDSACLPLQSNLEAFRDENNNVITSARGSKTSQTTVVQKNDCANDLNNNDVNTARQKKSGEHKNKNGEEKRRARPGSRRSARIRDRAKLEQYKHLITTGGDQPRVHKRARNRVSNSCQSERLATSDKNLQQNPLDDLLQDFVDMCPLTSDMQFTEEDCRSLLAESPLFSVDDIGTAEGTQAWELDSGMSPGMTCLEMLPLSPPKVRRSYQEFLLDEFSLFFLANQQDSTPPRGSTSTYHSPLHEPIAVAATSEVSSGFEPLSCRKVKRLRDLGLEAREEEVENSRSKEMSQEPQVEPIDTNEDQARKAEEHSLASENQNGAVYMPDFLKPIFKEGPIVLLPASPSRSRNSSRRQLWMSAVQVAEVWLPSYVVHADFRTVFFLPLGEWNPVEGVWHVHKILWRSRADGHWNVSQVAGVVMPPSVQVCFVPEEAWLSSHGVIPAYHSRVYRLKLVADHTTRSSISNRFCTSSAACKPFGPAGPQKHPTSLQSLRKTASWNKHPVPSSGCIPIPGMVPPQMWDEGGVFTRKPGYLLSPTWMPPSVPLPPVFPPLGGGVARPTAGPFVPPSIAEGNYQTLEPPNPQVLANFQDNLDVPTNTMTQNAAWQSTNCSVYGDVSLDHCNCSTSASNDSEGRGGCEDSVQSEGTLAREGFSMSTRPTIRPLSSSSSSSYQGICRASSSPVSTQSQDDLSDINNNNVLQECLDLLNSGDGQIGATPGSSLENSTCIQEALEQIEVCDSMCNLGKLICEWCRANLPFRTASQVTSGIYQRLTKGSPGQSAQAFCTFACSFHGAAEKAKLALDSEDRAALVLLGLAVLSRLQDQVLPTEAQPKEEEEAYCILQMMFQLKLPLTEVLAAGAAESTPASSATGDDRLPWIPDKPQSLVLHFVLKVLTDFDPVKAISVIQGIGWSHPCWTIPTMRVKHCRQFTVLAEALLDCKQYWQCRRLLSHLINHEGPKPLLRQLYNSLLGKFLDCPAGDPYSPMVVFEDMINAYLVVSTPILRKLLSATWKRTDEDGPEDALCVFHYGLGLGTYPLYGKMDNHLWKVPVFLGATDAEIFFCLKTVLDEVVHSLVVQSSAIRKNDHKGQQVVQERATSGQSGHHDSRKHDQHIRNCLEGREERAVSSVEDFFLKEARNTEVILILKDSSESHQDCLLTEDESSTNFFTRMLKTKKVIEGVLKKHYVPLSIQLGADKSVNVNTDQSFGLALCRESLSRFLLLAASKDGQMQD